MLNKSLIVLLSALMGAAAVGCGNNESAHKPENKSGGDSSKPVSQEPVTLNFYLNTVLSNDDFEMYMNQFIKKKFPNVTMKLVERGKGSELSDLITSGNIPDIVWEGLTNIRGSLELNLPADLSPLIKKQQFNWNLYDSKIIDSIKSYSKNGEIYYMPFNVFVFATQYNKDIFDKFGIAYLKDNMTWEEMIEIGKRMTQMEGGIQYRGLQISSVNRTQTQMSLSYVDPKTETAALQTDGWKKMFDVWKTVNDIPNQPKLTKFNTSRDDFYKGKTLAIFPDILMLQNTDMASAEKEGLKWDVVTFPTFKDTPGIGVGVFSDGFYIPNGSKNPDLAFQVIAYLSSHQEVQLAATKNGRITALNDPEIRKHAFENNPAAKGKNLKNIFNNQYPVPFKSTEYDRSALSTINKKIVEYVEGKSDLNTILRQADEELNKAIQQQKNK